jgi:predicted house-cleaning noncanonical NTP pyrophosphatase (MazG superfamily)
MLGPGAARQEQEMKLSQHGSLVRDHIERYLLDTGRHDGHVFRVADKSEYEDLLMNKLMEEAKEVIEATNRADLITELGDLLDVIEAIRVEHCISRDLLESYRMQKNQERGGYGGRVVWVAGADHSKDAARESPVT